MRLLPSIAPDWPGSTVVVAGSGASLTEPVAALAATSGHRIIAVNDTHRLLPTADILYACDADWWKAHDGVLGFAGERWSSHDEAKNNKLPCAEKWDLTLCFGRTLAGFSSNPAYIHYGQNSGFQAINIAILRGAKRILLIGFDMQGPNFFGRHPEGLRNSDKRVFVANFNAAMRADRAPKGVEIINCTPGSALKCFRNIPFEDALRG